MVDLVGTTVTEEEKVILKHPNVGALILFARNFLHPAQLQDLLETVRSIRPDIFIAVDQEGGFVQRFQRHGFRALPAARVYGDVFDLDPKVGIELAEKYGTIMAQDLLKYGIDLSLAPVLDIHGASDVIGKLDRAFHHDPDVVIALTTAFIQGMNKAGMPAVGKHFPGHGSVAADSHTSKPILDTPIELLREKDLKPFTALIKENLLAAVMPAHVIYTAIDKEQPSGFSEIWLQDILRNGLNFKGLILSDCLGMAGADIGNISTRAGRALKAGCDMLIVCNQSPALLYDLLQLVSFAQTQESAERIRTFKYQMQRFIFEKQDKITPYLSHTIHAQALQADITSEQQTNISNTTTSI